jgi:hypothetical protein
MYTDNEFKFMAILNSKVEIPQLLNALGHITAGIVAKSAKIEEMQFLKYEFSAQEIIPSVISRYPFIILSAKNNNQLKTLHQAVNEAGILHNVFTDSMLGISAIEQIDNTKNQPIENLTYFGIVLFGEADQLTALTRKFSLFKAS